MNPAVVVWRRSRASSEKEDQGNEHPDQHGGRGDHQATDDDHGDDGPQATVLHRQPPIELGYQCESRATRPAVKVSPGGVAESNGLPIEA